MKAYFVILAFLIHFCCCRFSPGPGLASSWQPRPRVIVIGDSLTRPLESHLAKSPHNCLVLPYPGATIYSLYLSVGRLLQDFDVQVVFVHVGTNSLGKVVTHRAVKQYRLLLAKLKDRFPCAHIIFNQILPRDDC